MNPSLLPSTSFVVLLGILQQYYSTNLRSCRSTFASFSGFPGLPLQSNKRFNKCFYVQPAQEIISAL